MVSSLKASDRSQVILAMRGGRKNSRPKGERKASGKCKGRHEERKKGFLGKTLVREMAGKRGTWSDMWFLEGLLFWDRAFNFAKYFIRSFLKC